MFDAVLKQARMAARVKRTLIGVLAVPAVYLLAVNLLLNSGVLPALISVQPERLVMGWGSAWSPWPGRVYVRDFYVRSSQPDLHFELTFDDAHASVEMMGLLERRFETRWVRAEGLEVRLRPRLPAGEEAALIAAPYPPIRGLTDDGLEADAVPAPPAEERFAVRLGGVSVREVREVWIGAYRARLDARVQGRMSLDTNGRLEVGPAQLVVDDGSVMQGATPVASALAGVIDCAFVIPDTDRRAGIDVLRQLETTLNLEGELASLKWLNYHLREHAHPELGGGKARFELGIGLSEGELKAGSQVRVSGGDFSAAARGYRLSGEWTAHGLALRDEDGVRSTLEVKVTPLRVVRESGEKLLETPYVSVAFAGTDVMLGELPEDGLFAVDVAKTEPFSLEELNRYLDGSDVKIDGGTATLEGRVALGPGAKTRGGLLSIRTSPTEVSWGRSRIRGEATVALDLARLRLLRKSADVSGSTLELRNVEVLSARGRSKHWNGTLGLQDAQVRLDDAVTIKANVAGSFSDARPFLALFGDQAGLPRWATGLLAAEGLEVSGNLEVAPASLAVRELDVGGEGVRLRGRLERSSRRTAGLFLVKVRGVDVGFRIADAQVETMLLEPEAWFEQAMLAAPN